MGDWDVVSQTKPEAASNDPWKPVKHEQASSDPWAVASQDPVYTPGILSRALSSLKEAGAAYGQAQEPYKSFPEYVQEHQAKLAERMDKIREESDAAVKALREGKPLPPSPETDAFAMDTAMGFGTGNLGKVGVRELMAAPAGTSMGGILDRLRKRFSPEQRATETAKPEIPVSGATPEQPPAIRAAPQTAAQAPEKISPVFPPPQAEPRGAPKRPPDILDFLAENGGIVDESGELRAMDAHKKFMPGSGMLVRTTGGRSLDYAREAAEQAGYLRPGSTISDLLDAVRTNLAGRRVFSDRHMTAAQEWDAARRDYAGQYRDEVEQRADQLGIEYHAATPTDDIIAQIHEHEAGLPEASEVTADRIEADLDRGDAAHDIPWFEGDEHVASVQARAQPGAGETLREAVTRPQGVESGTGARPGQPSAVGAAGGQAPRQGIGAQPLGEDYPQWAARRSIARGEATAALSPEERNAIRDYGRQTTDRVSPLLRQAEAKVKASMDAWERNNPRPGTAGASIEGGPAPIGGGSSGGGREPPPPPPPSTSGPFDPSRSREPGYLTSRLRKAGAEITSVIRDIQMKVAPMAVGTPEAQAAAKEFANANRLARYEGIAADADIAKRFKPDRQEAMWRAADEQSVAMQSGRSTEGLGISKLSPEEQAVVLREQARAKAAFDQARDLGMIESEGLPSYVPRMVVDMGSDGIRRVGTGEGALPLDQIGRNLRTTTSQLQHRKYLTTAETEAAARAKFGEGASVAQNIRALPLATARLEEAIAGRTLINEIKNAGKQTGEELVHEGGIPEGATDKQWFTLDHPAFKTWRPKFHSDATGRVAAVRDAEGNIVFERVPIYVKADFEGPLRAVLSQDSGKVYNALMSLKGRTMSVIMYSPLIHNAVEWGRALPAMPGKVATLKIYFEGNAAKKTPAVMREAINAGLVPIGRRAGFQDITSIMEELNIKPGRSFTAKLLGAVPDLFNPKAGAAVKRSVDRMGDVWHNTLLWDRVGDLQMGLYTNLRDSLMRRVTNPLTAQRVAAHFANRYAGALPIEAMSTASRKIANLVLFSRSFTLGNLGAMKDIITGLPRDIQAQILRDAGKADLKLANSYARRKAASIVAMDIALMYVGNSILQSTIAILSGDSSLDKESRAYARRFNEELSRVRENPTDLFNPFDVLNRLTPMSENEPGKEDRVLVGYAADGTAIYMRNPTGKIGEEFKGWITGPLDMIKRKLGTIARPVFQTISNDQGFGHKVYNPYAETPAEWVKNIGNIVWLFMGDQIPLQSIQAARDALARRGDTKTEMLQTLGPLAGFTFSKGAPGGPAVGQLYRSQEQHNFRVQQALPGIRRKITDGDIDGARDDMTALGIPPGLQNFYIRTTQDPKSRLSGRAMRDFTGYASPEELQRMNRLLDQGQR